MASLAKRAVRQQTAFLTSRFGARVKSIAAMQAGEWSHAYAFDLDGAGYVIRFSALEEDFAKDRIAGAWRGSAMYGDGLYGVALLRFWSPWCDGLRDSDVIEASRTGLGSDIDSTDFDDRLRAYQLHVGLSHIAYNAFKGPGRAEEMTRVCERVTEVGGAPLGS
jgi:hypothetical protein